MSRLQGELRLMYMLGLDMLFSMTEDPVKQAKALAERKVDQRVNLVKQLSSALQWERDIRELRTTAKSVAADAPDSAREAAKDVQDSLDALLRTAQHRTKDARSSARSEWTQGELRDLGLVPTRQRKSVGHERGESEKGQSDVVDFHTS